MSAIEKALARNNKQKNSDSAGNMQRQFPRRERLILTEKPVNRSAANSHPVPQGANDFTLPYIELEAEGMVEADGKRNQLSEEYRAIKRPILAAIDSVKENI